MKNSEKADIKENIEAAQKRPTEVEANKNMIGKETNRNKKQHEKTKNERKKQAVAKSLIVPEDELNKFGRS